MSMGVLPSWICLCVPGARRGDSLELGLQRLVSSYVGAEPGSSGRVVSAPNHQTNSPVCMTHWTFKAGDVLGDFFPCLKLTEYTCSWPGRNKNTWAHASPVSNQTKASKKLAFSWDSCCEKKAEIWSSQSRNLSSHSSGNLSDHCSGETGIETAMGRW